ncbi:MAG: B-box zinc finger protein [Bryobacteraceae bacterium]
MNCQNHPEISATAYCRACGKPLCDGCRREAAGTIYCDEHVPAEAAAPPPASGYTSPPFTPPYTSPYPPPPAYASSNVSPALAFFLGLIPGVGAIYNGQYAKGLVHAVVWGLLMSIADSSAAHGLEPVFVMLVIAWWAYMALEAHRTAQRLAAGEAVDEYSSILDMRAGSSFPVAAVGLIVLGVLLLLHTLDLLDFERVARYWPVLLIAAGVAMLWARLNPHDTAPPEVRHER